MYEWGPSHVAPQEDPEGTVTVTTGGPWLLKVNLLNDRVTRNNTMKGMVNGGSYELRPTRRSAKHRCLNVRTFRRERGDVVSGYGFTFG
jgi:hypothetical protein